MKAQSESSLLSGLRSQRGERVLEVDGTLTTQPVLEHVGISTWPGVYGLLMGMIKLLSCSISYFLFLNICIFHCSFVIYHWFSTFADAGRLTLTDHALYFEAVKVVTFDKPKGYELAEDLKQVVKPELTGPWGSRLFDKAVMYKSTTL
jgi:hypothetical protein